mmetsp:Transcript_9574/g.32877  ORF Transcript_9574/g.32877 Transcript_9574/m.32877 type:complete len:253 (-) Transcript_9574:1367-2125(-)
MCSISSSRSRWALRAIFFAAARASSLTSALASSETWCTALPSQSRKGPPRPPSPAVSEPPDPPAHVLPPTCGAPVSSTLPTLGALRPVRGVDAPPASPDFRRYSTSIFSSSRPPTSPTPASPKSWAMAALAPSKPWASKTSATASRCGAKASWASTFASAAGNASGSSPPKVSRWRATDAHSRMLNGYASAPSSWRARSSAKAAASRRRSSAGRDGARAASSSSSLAMSGFSTTTGAKASPHSRKSALPWNG